MNNRFTHSQEYVEYCQIIIIIILIIENILSATVYAKNISHQWLKNTNMLFLFVMSEDITERF